jgi:hypothetical protein
MYGNLGDGIVGLFFAMATLIVVFVPFGVWKVYELLSELFSHIHWQ